MLHFVCCVLFLAATDCSLLEVGRDRLSYHFPQMDRCCTSRGTETQQLFPSQSDGLPLVLHEYFTLSQNGWIPDSFNCSHTGPDDQIIKLYWPTSSHRQLEKNKTLLHISSWFWLRQKVCVECLKGGVNLGGIVFVVWVWVQCVPLCF